MHTLGLRRLTIEAISGDSAVRDEETLRAPIPS